MTKNVVVVFLLCATLMLSGVSFCHPRRLASSSIPSSSIPSSTPLPSSDHPPGCVSGSVKRPLLYGCRDQPLFTVVKPLGSGWTKSASLVKHNITGAVAVAKTVNRRGHIGMVDAEGAARLLLLEALFLEQLASPYVVELLGLCSRGEAHGLTVWVEYMDVGMLGSDEISALASWQERIHWARQAMLLMRFLESSPIGPVLVMDFKSSQFLASSAGLLKASDLDTIRILQPHETRGLNHAKPCRTDGDCTTYAFRSPEFKCTANQTCAGYSSLSNMYVPLFFCISRFIPHPHCFSLIKKRYHACRLWIKPLLGFVINLRSPVNSFDPPQRLVSSSSSSSSSSSLSSTIPGSSPFSKEQISSLQELFQRCDKAELSASEALKLLFIVEGSK